MLDFKITSILDQSFRFSDPPFLIGYPIREIRNYLMKSQKNQNLMINSFVSILPSLSNKIFDEKSTRNIKNKINHLPNWLNISAKSIAKKTFENSFVCNKTKPWINQTWFQKKSLLLEFFMFSVKLFTFWHYQKWRSWSPMGRSP